MFSLKAFLTEDLVIERWRLSGLPKDEQSVENGIIMQRTMKYPLLIDPQQQASKYIKSMGKEENYQGVECVKASDANLQKSIEQAVQFGRWLLVENVGEQLNEKLEQLISAEVQVR